MKRIKILGVSLIAGVLLPLFGGLAFSGNQNSDVATQVNETANTVTHQVVRNANEARPVEKLDDEEVKVSINKSQATSNSQSYHIEFSTEILTYTDKENQCFVKVEVDNKTLTELPEIMYVINEEEKTDRSKDTKISGKEIDEFKKEHSKDWRRLLRTPFDDELPSYDGLVYKITNLNKKKQNVVIPSALRYTNKFLVKVVEIGFDVIDHKKDELVKSILVPASVKTINHNAFIFPERVLHEGTDDEETIKNTTCQILIEGEKKPGYYDGFAEYPENVKYNQEYVYNNGKTPLVYGAPQPFGKPSAKYILGIKSDEYNYPLTVRYDYTDASGKLFKDNEIELSLISTKNPYDGVGSGVGGAFFSRYIDIDLNPGEKIVHESVTIRNIFKAVSKDSKWVPDLETEYYCKPQFSVVYYAELDKFIEYELSEVSEFMGFSTVTINANFSTVPYTYLKKAISEDPTNKKLIENGTYYIRFRFTSLIDARYEFTYYGDDGQLKTIQAKVDTPPNQFICEKESKVTFLFKNKDIAPDFDIEKVVKLDVLGLTITMDLFRADGGRATTGSETSSRFARVNLLDNSETEKVFDIDALFIWLVVGFTVAYIALTVVYYFYAKNKFKNDEFRRVRPKKFIKNALYGFLGTLLTILTVLFIVIRATSLNNSIIVFNPLDAFIIVFTIIDLIVAGYAIKTLVTRVKAYNEQKRNEKLKIADDVADDGTN